MHWRHKGSHLHNNDASLASRSAHVLCWQCALALSLSVRGPARRCGLQGLPPWLHAWQWRTWQCFVWPPTQLGALLWRHMHMVYIWKYWIDKNEMRWISSYIHKIVKESIKTSLPFDFSESDAGSEFSLFEALRESIYSEVASLISQNETRPHFLIELFRELQMLNSDYLRQRALYALQDLVSKYLTDDNTNASGLRGCHTAIRKSKNLWASFLLLLLLACLHFATA